MSGETAKDSGPRPKLSECFGCCSLRQPLPHVLIYLLGSSWVKTVADGRSMSPAISLLYFNFNRRSIAKSVHKNGLQVQIRPRLPPRRNYLRHFSPLQHRWSGPRCFRCDRWPDWEHHLYLQYPAQRGETTGKVSPRPSANQTRNGCEPVGIQHGEFAKQNNTKNKPNL